MSPGIEQETSEDISSFPEDSERENFKKPESLPHNSEDLHLNNNKRNIKLLRTAEEFTGRTKFRNISSSLAISYDRIHQLEQPSYRINEKQPTETKLSLPNIIGAESSVEISQPENMSSIKIFQNNPSLTEPFEMRKSKEPVKEEVFFRQQDETEQSPSISYDTKANQTKISGISHSFLDNSVDSNTNHHESDNVFRAFSRKGYSNTYCESGRATFPPDMSASTYTPFHNLMHTHAYPVILQYPFPYAYQPSPLVTSTVPSEAAIIHDNYIKPQVYTNVDTKVWMTNYWFESSLSDHVKEKDNSWNILYSPREDKQENSIINRGPLEEKFAQISSPFLRKLLTIVECPDSEHLCSWTKSGRSFVVWHPVSFENEVLPNYYKHSNFSSFVRQLNQYGFHKLHPEAWEFGHPLFLRKRIDLIAKICRRPSRKTHKHLDRIYENDQENQIQGIEDNGNLLVAIDREGCKSGSAAVSSQVEETPGEILSSLEIVEPCIQECSRVASSFFETHELIKRTEKESIPNSRPNFEKYSLTNECSDQGSSQHMEHISVDTKCIYEWTDSIYHRIGSIQEELGHLRETIQCIQEILSNILPKASL
eukprot:jgi/Galph1/4733/GphlegSOOS_G3360.1